MELRLVFRALRKISDWVVGGYYSQTLVEGKDHVPATGPLIIASTHHNDSIDVATLAVTIPHRRHLAFWAKSTLFNNSITGSILSSSGAIPVRRNPNVATTDPSSSSSSAKASKEGEVAARAVLFRDSSKALANDQVLGVFPEGTSYTQASILQVMPGAAWAAVEYVRYVRENADPGCVSISEKGKEKEGEMPTGLRIVPVAIVYTDKTRYQSRISVKYGEPIFVDVYAAQLFIGDQDAAEKTVVKEITAEVGRQLWEMTINAPDWDTICATSMARSILWDDERNINLKDWVGISQAVIKMLIDAPELKEALARYYALLHYSGTRHSVLLSLLPLSAPLETPPPHAIPASTVLIQPSISILASLPLSLVRFILFLPPLLLHFPGYISGSLIGKLLAVPGEEESPAQFKAVGGGLGIAANIALAFGVLWRKGGLSALPGFPRVEGVKHVLGLVGTIYCSVWLLVKWHGLLVKANYRQLQRLVTYRNLFRAFAFPQHRLTTAEVDAYAKPPLPALNAYLKKREEFPVDHKLPKPIAAWKLVRHLLHARTVAIAALSEKLKARDQEALLGFLKSRDYRSSMRSRDDRCLYSMQPPLCPLCRKIYQPAKIKKLHVDKPEDIDDHRELDLLQRLTLSWDLPDDQLEDITDEVDAWLEEREDDVCIALRKSRAALARHRELKESEAALEDRVDSLEEEMRRLDNSIVSEQNKALVAAEAYSAKIERLEKENYYLKSELQTLQTNQRNQMRNPLPPPPEPISTEHIPSFAQAVSDPSVRFSDFSSPQFEVESRSRKSKSKAPLDQQYDPRYQQAATPLDSTQPLDAFALTSAYLREYSLVLLRPSTRHIDIRIQRRAFIKINHTQLQQSEPRGQPIGDTRRFRPFSLQKRRRMSAPSVASPTQFSHPGLASIMTSIPVRPPSGRLTAGPTAPSSMRSPPISRVPTDTHPTRPVPPPTPPLGHFNAPVRTASSVRSQQTIDTWGTQTPSHLASESDAASILTHDTRETSFSNLTSESQPRPPSPVRQVGSMVGVVLSPVEAAEPRSERRSSSYRSPPSADSRQRHVGWSGGDRPSRTSSITNGVSGYQTENERSHNQEHSWSGRQRNSHHHEERAPSHRSRTSMGSYSYYSNQGHYWQQPNELGELQESAPGVASEIRSNMGRFNGGLPPPGTTTAPAPAPTSVSASSSDRHRDTRTHRSTRPRNPSLDAAAGVGVAIPHHSGEHRRRAGIVREFACAYLESGCQ
ncbi:hypothetical protein NLJ89_g4397 [Agrocybe chaxingu]|uniref:Phospholipid/glycerol acyltransferase domain-containing protein n=1 Tax=Agrocybe chaxingu TaxID=84603 RepID=A0A9W8K3E1_9AGAR|nr:hypothetical protein NLJ89_g4397 [Agrocybe chaxingu]